MSEVTKEMCEQQSGDMMIRVMRDRSLTVASVIREYPAVIAALLETLPGSVCEENIEKLAKAFQEYTDEMREVTEKSLTRSLFRNGIIPNNPFPEERRSLVPGLGNWISRKKK